MHFYRAVTHRIIPVTNDRGLPIETSSHELCDNAELEDPSIIGDITIISTFLSRVLPRRTILYAWYVPYSATTLAIDCKSHSLIAPLFNNPYVNITSLPLGKNLLPFYSFYKRNCIVIRYLFTFLIDSSVSNIGF